MIETRALHRYACLPLPALLLSLLAATTMAAAAGGASAQGVPLRARGVPPGQVLTGRVLDAATGRPLFGAVVGLPDLGVEAQTDSVGRFVLHRVGAGTHKVYVSEIGYRDLLQRVELSRDGADLRVEPDPVLLKGIAVLADRFRARREAAPYAAVAFDRETLLRSGAADMREFLSNVAGITLVPCPREPFATCALVNRRPARTAVFVDERRAYGGIEELTSYLPSDLFLLEVYGEGRMVRAYTGWWFARSARKRLLPVPLF